MWCLEIDTLSHGLASITQETGSAQCLVPSGRTSTIMVNLPVGFQMESWLSDGVHTNPSILANRNILVPAKYLAPRDGFIAFTLVQGTNSRLDFFKRCDAFHWAAPLPAFPRFPEASFSCLFFIYVSEVYIVWHLLWAAGCFSWKKNVVEPSAGCPHRAVSWKFPLLEITLCCSKAWSQPSGTKQPGFFTVSGSLAIDLCST